MANFAREAEVACFDEQGRLAAKVRIVQSDAKPPTIRILRAAEATEFGEEQVQLLEGWCYDFELLAHCGQLCVQPSGLVKPNSIRPAVGRIETGAETGLLQITLGTTATGQTVARGSIEIVSTKLNYRTDYRGMLSAIAEQCGELLFDLRTTARMRIAPTNRSDPHNLPRQIEFLSALLGSKSFRSALERITATPHHTLFSNVERRSISQLRRPGKDFARQISTSKNRIHLDESHSLAAAMQALGVARPSLPSFVTVRRNVESTDTAENRFVKHVLSHFADFLQRIQALLEKSKGPDQRRLRRSIQRMKEFLGEVLSRDFFKGIGPPQFLPLGSPVLHRKPGYREILTTWLKFDLAAQLVWQGGEDVYGAGKRDMAALYEYWVFFQLLRLFRDKFELAVPLAHELFEHSNGGLSLRLKSHCELGIRGRSTRHPRHLQVNFSYNRTQQHSAARATAGSWTRRMRPDYTLSFWPDGFELAEAEAQELVVHIHFDAKYRVENIAEIFGSADEDIIQTRLEERRGNYRRADLLKMHAYRDAIRRSEGAYIIYPGARSDSTEFKGFHEILPGLGAFSIKPGSDGQPVEIQHLSRFLDEVIAHVANRATSRERGTFHQFNVYRNAESRGSDRVNEAVPERDFEGRFRSMPPADHSVLVGWCESDDQLAWIKRTGLYNFRAGTRRGAIRLNPEIAGARHLLLHSHGSRAMPGMFRVKQRGPRVFTGYELLNHGYPLQPSSDAIYAVFDVEPDSFYAGWEWRYELLTGRKSGLQSAEPFAVSLAEVLAIHRV
ncbi:DUF2357 domain-containing protein [Horticoccus sp. 23ND18S-11]|uniref:DUF2357 domain-containing protein n=1 Tax=Horticoccus sp. 23ND18S-11 TaxID=3391832 RepID=UPI0039C9E328